MRWTIIEYLDPVSPVNRRSFEPFGLGPVDFEDTVDGAMEFFQRLGGAPSPFRVVTVEYAEKNKLRAQAPGSEETP